MPLRLPLAGTEKYPPVGQYDVFAFLLEKHTSVLWISRVVVSVLWASQCEDACSVAYKA